jgi:hypothetical protein
MPYQIQLILDPDYLYKKKNWFYALYYDVKYLFVKQNHQLDCLIINTVNTDYEAIYETFQYLVQHKYGGLCMDTFIEDIKNDKYDYIEELYVDKIYKEYDDNGKDLDEDIYMNSKLVEFLTNQTNSIDFIHKTCLKYCDSSYNLYWTLQFEFTE